MICCLLPFHKGRDFDVFCSRIYPKLLEKSLAHSRSLINICWMSYDYTFLDLDMNTWMNLACLYVNRPRWPSIRRKKTWTLILGRLGWVEVTSGWISSKPGSQALSILTILLDLFLQFYYHGYVACSERPICLITLLHSIWLLIACSLSHFLFDLMIWIRAKCLWHYPMWIKSWSLCWYNKGKPRKSIRGMGLEGWGGVRSLFACLFICVCV